MCHELAISTWEWDHRFIIVFPWKHQLRVQYWPTLSIVYGSCPCLQNTWLYLLNCGRIEKGKKDAQRKGMVSMHGMTEQHRDNLGCATGLIKLSWMELRLTKKNCFLTQQIVSIRTQCRVQTVLHQFREWLCKKRSLGFTKYTECQPGENG